METIQAPILLLGMALLFALAIERLIEILKAVYKHLDANLNFSRVWTKRAEKVRDKLEARLDHAKLSDGQSLDVVLSLSSRYLADPALDGSNKLVICADKVREMGMKVRYKGLGVALGMLISFSLELDVFALLEVIQASQQINPEIIPYAPHCFGMLVMGIGMGLGAGPMQKMISALEGAQKFRQKTKGR